VVFLPDKADVHITHVEKITGQMLTRGIHAIHKQRKILIKQIVRRNPPQDEEAQKQSQPEEEIKDGGAK